jgi:hypothetical protein
VQQLAAAACKSLAIPFNHGAIWHVVQGDNGFPGAALLVELAVQVCEAALPKKGPCISTATLETGAVPGRKCRHLVEEEELCITLAPHMPWRAVPEGKKAGDPAAADPAAAAELLAGQVKAATAIAHEHTLGR